jgi:hypothetical protein
VRLDQFVGYRTDAIWGRQTVQRSLKGILGTDTASQFYSRNQGRGGRPAVAPVGPSLNAAATIQDLRDFMSAKYPWIEFDPAVRGIQNTESTFAHWREAVSEFDRLATKYPDEMRRLQGFRGERNSDRRNKNSVGLASYGVEPGTSREIVLRTRLMSDPTTLQPYDNPNSFGAYAVKDTNEVRTTTCHESGHIVDFPRALLPNPAIVARPPDVGDRAPLSINGVSASDTIQAARDSFASQYYVPTRRGQLFSRGRPTLSEYGMSSPAELMAEAFVAREYVPQEQWTPVMRAFDQYMQATDLSRISPAP